MPESQTKIVYSPKNQTRIVYSRDDRLYYISHPLHRSRHWMEVENREGEVPNDQKQGTFEGVVEIRKTTDGRVYWKRVYPFSFYDIKPGRAEAISEDADLFKDYASMERWPVPNTREFAAEKRQEIENTRSLLTEAKRSVKFYEDRLAALEAASRVEERPDAHQSR